MSWSWSAWYKVEAFQTVPVWVIHTTLLLLEQKTVSVLYHRCLQSERRGAFQAERLSRTSCKEFIVFGSNRCFREDVQSGAVSIVRRGVSLAFAQRWCWCCHPEGWMRRSAGNRTVMLKLGKDTWCFATTWSLLGAEQYGSFYHRCLGGREDGFQAGIWSSQA